MKFTNKLIAVLICSLGFISLSANGAPKTGPKSHKFKAEFSTEFQNSNFDPTTFLFTTVVNGTGNATFLGNTSFDAEHTFAFTTPTQTAGIAWDGILKLGAANGDVLNATYVGDIILSGDPAFPFLLLFEITFDGGTGRFANATGSADVIGLTTIEPDPTNGLFKGTSEFIFDGTLSFK